MAMIFWDCENQADHCIKQLQHKMFLSLSIVSCLAIVGNHDLSNLFLIKEIKTDHQYIKAMMPTAEYNQYRTDPQQLIVDKISK